MGEPVKPPPVMLVVSAGSCPGCCISRPTVGFSDFNMLGNFDKAHFGTVVRKTTFKLELLKMYLGKKNVYTVRTPTSLAVVP